LRKAGTEAAIRAGIEISDWSSPVVAGEAIWETHKAVLEPPLEIDSGIRPRQATVLISATVSDQSVPLLTLNLHNSGQVLMLNVWTFNEQDFRDADEWLLAFKPLGLSAIPQSLADALRTHLLAPLTVEFKAPAGVGLYLFEHGACIYNFRAEPVSATLGTKPVRLAARDWTWVPGDPKP
jgi:hypothetical protein